MDLPQRVRDVVRCPACKSALRDKTSGLVCETCPFEYPYTNSGSPDLRLRSAIKIPITLQIGPDAVDIERYDALSPFQPCKNPAVGFNPNETKEHIDSNLLSYFTKAKSPEDLALDIGCGANTIHKPLIEKCGYVYAGLDYSRAGATLLGDAHALPFESNSISFGISVAVLEHLAHPVLALMEVFRVLKPGARFIGTVAFLEPFHSNSFYHHTHRGLANGLLQAGFEIQQLGYNPDWIAPISLHKKFFPKLSKFISKPLIWPLYAGSLLFWKLGALRNRNKKLIHLFKRDLAGSFLFSCEKPLTV